MTAHADARKQHKPRLAELPHHDSDIDPDLMRALYDSISRSTFNELDLARPSLKYILLGFFLPTAEQPVAAVFCTRRSYRRSCDWASIVAVATGTPNLMTASVCKQLAQALHAYTRVFLATRVIATLESERIWPSMLELPGAVPFPNPSLPPGCPREIIPISPQQTHAVQG